MNYREQIPKQDIERRKKSRELAFQALFQYDIQSSKDTGILDLFIRENSDDELIRRLAREWVMGTIDKQEQIDELMTAVLKRWKITALMPVERAILRLSIYQLEECDYIPAKVVINEAIELAKKFSTENSPGFVNGILDAMLRKMTEQTPQTPSQPEHDRET